MGWDPAQTFSQRGSRASGSLSLIRPPLREKDRSQALATDNGFLLSITSQSHSYWNGGFGIENIFSFFLGFYFGFAVKIISNWNLPEDITHSMGNEIDGDIIFRDHPPPPINACVFRIWCAWFFNSLLKFLHRLPFFPSWEFIISSFAQIGLFITSSSPYHHLVHQV